MDEGNLQLFTALVFETGSFRGPGALQCNEVSWPVSSRDQPVCYPTAVVTGMYQPRTWSLHGRGVSIHTQVLAFAQQALTESVHQPEILV